ncbi:hypothetical protein EMH19_28405 [Klebsiella pneumoniae]
MERESPRSDSWNPPFSKRGRMSKSSYFSAFKAIAYGQNIVIKGFSALVLERLQPSLRRK